MAWTTLKAAIQAVIRPNENKEITGQILQNVLVSIVDNIGSIAGYKGVAVPTTVPPAIAGYAFYIAAQNGAYANFGGLIISNEIAILYNDGATWYKARVLKTVPFITTNSATGDRETIRNSVPLDDRKTGYVFTYVEESGERIMEVFLGSSFDGEFWSGDSDWLRLVTGLALAPDGDASSTTVSFSEASGEGLPFPGDTQAVLWSKVVYYLNTFFPTAIEGIITELSNKLDSDGGDGSSVQAGQNVDEGYTTEFPNDGEHWPLYTWFGVIRAKIERLFDVKLDTTGNGSDTTVNFAEAGVTALPASGEKQSVLWGKVLRYLKTVIPTLLEEKATQFPGICAETPILASDISINYGTRVLTINRAGGFHYFTDGGGVITKHTVAGAVSFPAFDDISGIWNFYFDNAGNAVVTQSPIPNFDSIAMVYRILWNATLTGSEKSIVETFECHQNTISGIDHTWKHKYGAIQVSGGDCSNNKLTTGSPNADGRNAVISLSTLTNLDDNLEYTITNSSGGTLWQQDLGNTNPALLNSTNSALMKVRVQNAGGLVSYLPATRFPFSWDVTTNRAEYITSTGVRTLVNNGNFFVYYVYALQDPRNGEAIKLVSATSSFTTLTNAQASSWGDIQATYSSLNDNEIRPLYRLIFVTGASYDIGTKKARLQEVQDLRVTRVTATTASGIVLASGVTVTPVGGISSTNVQSAIEELDTEKVAISGGESTLTESASNSGMTYDQVWPAYATKWSLLNWFGAIRAKLDYLFGKRSLILNVTATRTLATDDWTFGAFSTSQFAAIAAIASNGAPIYVRFSGTTNGVAEPVMLYPGLWNETLQQITSRDLARGFYLNGGVASNRGARSYDTQKYIDIGAVFNDVTGYYEYLGLTDNTESACREAYNLWLGPKTPFYFNYRNLVTKKTKFLFPITWVDENLTSARPTLFYGSAKVKRIRLCADMTFPDSPTNLFYAGGGIAYLTASSEITYIGGGIDMKSVGSDANASNLISARCTHIMLYNCKVNINLSASTILDYESVLNVPKYSAATSTKVFTLASAVAASARAAYLLNPEAGYATLDLYSQSKNYNIATV